MIKRIDAFPPGLSILDSHLITNNATFNVGTKFEFNFLNIIYIKVFMENAMSFFLFMDVAWDLIDQK